MSTTSTSAVWNTGFKAEEAVPGLRVRTPTSDHKVDVILEEWAAGSSEPPHSHPGDDMTIVVEGRMTIQFFKRDASGALQKDGELVTLKSGETGYVAANRIHDAKYVEFCRLAYVHSGAFGFVEEKQ